MLPGSQALLGDWLPISGPPYKSAPQWGHVAEWLRSGLQNRLHQFNSGRGLQYLAKVCFSKST
jgi:hypothetical protein